MKENFSESMNVNEDTKTIPMDKLGKDMIVHILVNPNDGGGKEPMILFVTEFMDKGIMARTVYDKNVYLPYVNYGSVWSVNENELSVISPMP